MGLLSLTLPTIGQPNATEDSKVRDALSTIATEFNGNIETTNLASSVTQQLIPVGTILPYGGSSAPSGFLLCDGTAVTRGSFSALFAVLGESYGVGDGSTTFNLPDLRGRTPVGEDGAAGRLSANDALGNASGAETHTLSAAEMPPHTHSVSGAANNGGGANVTIGSTTVDRSYTTSSAGSGSAHNNMQPYQIVNYIIKH